MNNQKEIFDSGELLKSDKFFKLLDQYEEYLKQYNRELFWSFVLLVFIVLVAIVGFLGEIGLYD